MKRKVFAAIAIAIVILATLFPIHIEEGNYNNGIFQIGHGHRMLVIGPATAMGADGFDYTCDGVADEVQWQAILNDLPGVGGQILAHAGAYNFTAGETVTRAIDNVSIIGVSTAVSFQGDGVTSIFEAGGDKWLFSNLQTDAGGLEMSTTSDWMWLHVYIDTTYYPLRTDGINIEDHSSLHSVGGSDTVFPTDPNADKFLMWDDVPGQLSWEDAGGGDMLKSTYDTDEDGDIDTAAGGTEWDSSAVTGVAYITAGAWGTRATGISNTYILVVDGTPNDDEYARFTPSGLEGRTENEFKQDYNLEIGTDVQAYDAELAAIAGLTSAADKMIYFTGSGTAATSDLTAFARSILDDANEATFKATVNLVIGTNVQAWDTDLDDIAALSDADSNFIVGNGANWVVESGATVRESLGLIIGTDVQAYDSELAALAGVTSAVNKVPYFTGSGTANVTDLTSYGRSLIATTNEAGFKQFVNLEIGTDIISKSSFDTHEVATTGVHGVTGTILGTEALEWTAYTGNPILSPEGTEDNTTFMSVFKDGSTYHGYYVYHDASDYNQIGHATSSDGKSWTKDTGNNPMLTKGAASAWDEDGVSVPMVWKEGSTWYMIYRGKNSSSEYQAGLATASDPAGTWTKDGTNPVLDKGGAGDWDESGVEIWGIIKVGTTYYAYYSTVVPPRKVGVATCTSLTSWTKDSNNPIFTDERFTPGVFKNGSYYYLLVPHYFEVTTPRKSVLELYRDASPTFYSNSREYLGVVKVSSYIGWDCATIDTPFVLTDDIERDTYAASASQFWCYYGAYSLSMTWQEGLLIEPDIGTAITPRLSILQGVATNAIAYTNSLKSVCIVSREDSAQAIPSGVMTQIQWNTETHDALDEFDVNSTYQYTATHPCVILITACAKLDTLADQDRISLQIQQNSTAIYQSADNQAVDGYQPRISAVTTTTVDIGDTIGGYIYHDYGSDRDLLYSSGSTMMSIVELMPL